MKLTKNVVLMFTLSLILSGCLNSSSWFGRSLWTSGIDSGTDFAADNDAVFDLFEDDFGTGTQYDDRFIGSGDGDLPAGQTHTSADGQIDYSLEPSGTVDPAYDEIGGMTPDELHGQEAIDIPVLMLGNNFFPFPEKQFGAKVSPDLCNHAHYHGASGYTLDRQNIPEPSDPCGFDNTTKIMSVTGDEMIEWFHNRPRNF